MTITKTINTELIREDQIETLCNDWWDVIAWEILKYASEKNEPWKVNGKTLILNLQPKTRKRNPSDYSASNRNCLIFSKIGCTYEEVKPYIYNHGNGAAQINMDYLKATVGFYIWIRGRKELKDHVTIKKLPDNKVEATYEFNPEDFDYELALVK